MQNNSQLNGSTITHYALHMQNFCRFLHSICCQILQQSIYNIWSWKI